MSDARFGRAVQRALAVQPKIVDGDPPHLIKAFSMRGDMIRSFAERTGLLERQNAKLAAELASAKARIAELESTIHPFTESDR